MAATEEAGPTDGAAAAGGEAAGWGAKRKVRRRPRAAAAEPGAAVEARLAAFGEAFLDSIEEAEAPPRRRPAPPPRGTGSKRPAPLRDPANERDADTKKDKKRRRRAANTQGTGAGAGVSTPLVTKEVTAPATDKQLGSAQQAGPSTPGSAAQLSTLGEGPSDGKARRLGPGISAAERRRFMSGKISQIRSEGQKGDAGTRRRRGDQGDPEEDAQFNKALKEVLDFVTPQLEKSKRRQYEEAKLMALGATLDKGPKINYAAMQRDARARKVRRQERLKNDKLLGIVSDASQHRGALEVSKLRKEKKEELKEKKRRRENGLLRLGMGAYEKRGLATIPQHAIRSFKQKGKR